MTIRSDPFRISGVLGAPGQCNTGPGIPHIRKGAPYGRAENVRASDFTNTTPTFVLLHVFTYGQGPVHAPTLQKQLKTQKAT